MNGLSDTAQDTVCPSSETRYRDYLATRYFQNLNGLRFICIAMVLWHHAQPVKATGWQILDRGFLGVDFFFVLSGFLITTLLLRERSTYGRFSLRAFYVRRFLRIVPVYFFVVTLVAFLLIGVKQETQYLTQLPYYYLFLSNFLTDHIPTLSITWSLSVEEQYYVLWPVCLLLLPARWVIPSLLFFILLNVVAAMGLLGISPIPVGPLLLKLPTATYAPILIGTLIAVLLNTSKGFQMLDAMLRPQWMSVALAVGLLVAIQVTPSDISGLPNLIIHMLMGAFLVTLVLQEQTVWSPVLTQRSIARIGEISYGIYLYHLLALHVAHAFGLTGSWMVLIGYSVISVLMAEISFRTLESYFLRLRPANSSKIAADDLNT